MIKSQVFVCEFAKNRFFWNFYSIDGGNVFIRVFKAVGIDTDNRDNLHRNNIKQAVFCDLNPFCRKVIH